MEKSQLGILVEELGTSDYERKLWQKLLQEATSGAEASELRERLREPLLELLKELGEGSFGTKLQLVSKKLKEFPTVDILPLVLELCGELRQEKEQALQEFQQMLSELATPVIRIWTDVLLVPLVGGLDSDRAQGMVERLLERASSTRAKVVIVDVSGVPMIDTAAGGFLIEMFSAVKLLGADVILTGLKPEVAHTLVKLGIDFQMVVIARDLEDALRRAIAMLEEEKRQQQKIARVWGGGFLGEGEESDEV
ncbi:MAG: Anti-sigma-factor antagonist [Thermoanaerobacterales bacterium 50_218]|nr:MAG: Anti-sigma-factor antagonist [Thermoanaerobacterales bacterium 50_218]HAA90184.1 sulfate transporter [Peptococcaceae bacterium]